MEIPCRFIVRWILNCKGDERRDGWNSTLYGRYKNPEESFSVAEFQERVRKHIREITERGKLPIIVGGTGLYIQSVLFDYQFTDDAGDAIYREQMEKLALERGVEYVHKKLQEVDPESAERIHANNVRRVIRALEIFTRRVKNE